MTVELQLVDPGAPSRIRRDRLEVLTALIDGPGFDPTYRPDHIVIAPDHAVYAWQCSVDQCDRIRRWGQLICSTHYYEWKSSGLGRAKFIQTARPLQPRKGVDLGSCRICADLPAYTVTTRLCKYHGVRWRRYQRAHPEASFEEWKAHATTFAGFGPCRINACPYNAAFPIGLCEPHQDRYYRAGRPGGAAAPTAWRRGFEQLGDPVAISYEDGAAFLRWCSDEDPIGKPSVINLAGLHPLLKAEIKWGLNAHARMKHRASWEVGTVQRLANRCRRLKLTSLADLTSTREGGRSRKDFDSFSRALILEIADGLRRIYYSPQDTKDAGFIETEHFGRRFPNTQSHFDLAGVPQRWLRNLLWEHLARVLRSAQCPRSRGPFDSARRAIIELGAFLEIDAPQGGHEPALLRSEHAERFAADLLNRERHGLPSLGLVRGNGEPSIVTFGTRRLTFNHARKVMFEALSCGEPDKVGLPRSFIVALPSGGKDRKVARNPFTDDVARALADEANLQLLAGTWDPNDRGLRDIWETIVATGRRCSEVVKLSLDCVGRYRGLPMLWHDQTKVGNYNAGIRIPEFLYDRLEARRAKTLVVFEDRFGRPPSAEERRSLVLFPNAVRNPDGTKSISYGHFSRCFKEWVDSLDLGGNVIHQARHTLATKLLAAGASLAHIKRYLGQVSERMAEHYVKVSNSDLDDLLAAIWVAGPGSVNPGELLSSSETPLSKHEAMALALDLSRRSTPAEGGVCTFQPVVDGNACPWNLDCTNCDKFVLSGADLLYWRRKAEQWRSIAERAPTDEAANYLHTVFEPTARAIAGLEKALAGLGLLDQALALDLRRPQDYFQRIWSLNFRAGDLAALTEHEDDD
ncbi:tyrosine-type recombinase/integrase [Nonomuraea sp. NPDC052265]|uniref:tyrosine-type recombinase/integrase n=1 Tax=Nonomuraea sp. NPDC052265 TaxID=3364374 RepID=UPI0037C9CFF9